MPGGNTHDAITFFLIVPTFAAGYALTLDPAISTAVTAGMLVGGLMFGPDLDIQSKQHSRWGILRFLWGPYKAVFKHRSRWSHGLIFGTLFRVVYLLGMLTLTGFLMLYVYAAFAGGDLPNLLQLTQVWTPVGNFVREHAGDHLMPSIFVGLWLGAASHTFTDMAGTFIKTGKITEFL